MKQTSRKHCRKSTALKPLIVALGLALPSVPAFAVGMTDLLSTRADRAIDERYGRDSVYAVIASKGPRRGQTLVKSGWPLGKTKSYRAAAFDRPDPSVTHRLAISGDQLSTGPLQRFGRAGGYIGWERIAVQRSTTIGGVSTLRDRRIASIAAGHEDNLVALRPSVQPFRRESAVGFDAADNHESPATSRSEKLWPPRVNAILSASEQPDTAEHARTQQNVWSVDGQARTPVQRARDMSAVENRRRRQDGPGSEAQLEAVPFRPAEDGSAIVREESANDAIAQDNAHGAQAVVRTLPEQAPLRPDQESDFDFEDRQVVSVPAQSWNDRSVMYDPNLEQPPASMAVNAPVGAPSDYLGASAHAAAALDEELVQRTNSVERQQEELPEAEIIVTGISEEPAGESIRMSKRIE